MDRKVVKVATPIPPDATADWIQSQVAENIVQAQMTAHRLGMMGEMKVLLVVEQEVLSK